MSFDKAFEKTVAIEGKYSDHASDRGGKTMYGITEKVARAYGYNGDMRDLPLDTAKAIYRARYWDLINLDLVDKHSPAIAHEIFDSAVNMGVVHPPRWLQRALNLLNRGGRDFDDIPVDGLIGPRTIGALRAYLNLRGGQGENALLKLLNTFQSHRYVEIAEASPSQEDFVNGWMKRVGL